MARAKVAPKWAKNARQWLKTAETDAFHAVGQSELGKDEELTERYIRLAHGLSRMVRQIEKKYGIKSSRGRRERQGE